MAATLQRDKFMNLLSIMEVDVVHVCFGQTLLPIDHTALWCKTRVLLEKASPEARLDSGSSQNSDLLATQKKTEA